MAQARRGPLAPTPRGTWGYLRSKRGRITPPCPGQPSPLRPLHDAVLLPPITRLRTGNWDQVPVSQDAKYSTWPCVNASICTPRDLSLSRATSRSMSSGTG